MGGEPREPGRYPAREERFPETDKELREFLADASFGVRWVRPDGRILWANAAELEMVGCSEGEYVGHHIAEFFAEPETASEVLRRLASGSRIEGYRTRIRTRHGAIREVLIDASGLFRDGRFVHARYVTQDITALLESEQAVRQRAEETSRVRDEFLALLSHELRAPLAAILVWMGLLRQGGFEREESERALEIVERSARSLERIVEDLLHASRIAAGGLLLSRQLVDFRGVVQAASDAATADAALNELQLACSQGQIPVWVRGDPGRLQQAVSNLLANAIKFTPAGGRIDVVLDTLDQQARLRVADTGEGMSSGFLPFAFERFRQQDSTSTRAHHGLGLGLYVVRHVISHHGGLVSAESPGPGRGSTFTVLLPLAAEPKEAAAGAPAGPESSESEAQPPAGLKVLLVEDERDTREALRVLLQQNGLLVTTAASAREALELIERLRPDVLLSDIAMPGEDGISLIRRVRMLPLSRGGRIPAAALSAYAGAEDRRKALLAGFQYHFPKPVNPSSLLAAIAAMAGTSAPDSGEA